MVFDGNDDMILPLFVLRGHRVITPSLSRRSCLAVAVDPRTGPAEASVLCFLFCVEKAKDARCLNQPVVSGNGATRRVLLGLQNVCLLEDCVAPDAVAVFKYRIASVQVLTYANHTRDPS